MGFLNQIIANEDEEARAERIARALIVVRSLVERKLGPTYAVEMALYMEIIAERAQRRGIDRLVAMTELGGTKGLTKWQKLKFAAAFAELELRGEDQPENVATAGGDAQIATQCRDLCREGGDA